MEKYAIIVAGGNGHRMNASIPKQFLNIANYPVLYFTLRVFEQIDAKIILVMNEQYLQYWKDLCQKLEIQIPHALIAGGETRADSVKNGLDLVPNNALVAVHDAVRPFVTKKLVESLYDKATLAQNAVPVIDLKDSIRVFDHQSNSAVDRKKYKAVQTPQVFASNLLKAAYANTDYKLFTDEASLVEHCGTSIHCINGENNNIKITTPEDLLLAEAILKQINYEL